MRRRRKMRVKEWKAQIKQMASCISKRSEGKEDNEVLSSLALRTAHGNSGCAKCDQVCNDLKRCLGARGRKTKGAWKPSDKRQELKISPFPLCVKSRTRLKAWKSLNNTSPSFLLSKVARECAFSRRRSIIFHCTSSTLISILGICKILQFLRLPLFFFFLRNSSGVIFQD